MTLLTHSYDVAALPPNPPSKHHYIPEFLLKRWAGDDGKITSFTSPVSGKIVRKRCFPSQVGFKKDLYRSPIDDPVAAQALETNFFSLLDNFAAKALDNLLVTESETLNQESVQVLCLFIFSLLHRNPTYFDSLIRMGEDKFRSIITDLEKDYGAIRSDGDPKSFQEFSAKINADFAKIRIFSVVPDLMLNENILTFMRDMHWSVLVATNIKPNLLLSDDPLVRTNGLKRLDGQLVLPISPTRLVVGTSQPTLLRAFQSDSAVNLIKQVNAQTVEAARLFVVATDDRQTRFIENRFGNNPRPPLFRSSE